MTKPELSYDPECEVLARYFLADAPVGANIDDRAKRLAQHIQEAVETWLDDLPKCECGDVIWVGQTAIRSTDCGFIHLDCCDEDGFVDENDEPLPLGAPTPQGFVWSEEDDRP